MDAAKDAEIIHDAIDGAGTDEQKAIDVLCRRPNWHVQKIREQYEKKYHTDLVKDIHKDTSGNLRLLLTHLVKSRGEIRATHLKEAMEGTGTHEGVLIDIICQSSNKSLESFKQVFRQKYEISVAEEIKKETAGNLEKLLLSCLEAKREQGVNKSQVEKDAEALYKAGEAKWGTDDNTFIEILSKRSHAHLKEVADKYKQKYNKDIVNVIKSETSGYFETALLTCLVEPKIYWAKRIHNCISGIGTNDSRLRRCFLLNSKPALARIADEYEKLFEKKLADEVKKDTSGWYQKVYLTLLDFPASEKKLY